MTETKRKKFFLFFGLVFLNVFLYLSLKLTFLSQPTISQAQTPPQTKYLFLVSIDGLRSSEAFDALNPSQYIPNLWNNLRPQGSLYRNIYNLGATWTTPGNDTLVDGCWELTPNNEGGLGFRPQCPTIFEYYRQTYPSIPQEKVWAVVGKDNCYLANYSPHPLYGKNYQASINYPTASGDRSDEETWTQMQTIIEQNHPSLVFLHLGEVDHAGHSGWTEYLQAIKDADKIVYDLWNKIQADPVYRNQTTLLITTDHGRHDDQHGGFGGHSGICEGCKKIFLLALGPEIKNGQEFYEFRQQVDIVPTIGELLGFNTPFAQGKILKEMLKDFQESPPTEATLAENEEKITNTSGSVEHPSIAINQSGLHLVWTDDRAGQKEILYKSRPAGSNQWTEDFQLSFAEKEARAPAITAEANTVHVVWQEYSEGNWEIVYRRGDSSGKWTPKIILGKSLPEASGEGPQMLWEPKISLCQGQPLVAVPLLPNSLNLYRRFSDDYWSQKTFVFQEKALAQGIDLVSADKYAYLFWLQSGVNWEIRYSRSENCGQTWSEAASLTRIRGEQDIKSAASGLNLYTAWIRPESALLWGQSGDKGLNWSSPTPLHSQKAWQPNLALSGSKFSLVWEDYRNGLPSVYFAESTDMGFSWHEQKVSFGDRFSFEPAVATDGKSSFIVWRDNRNGSWQLYFTQIGTTAISTTPPPTQVQPSPTISPSPTPILSPQTECEKRNGVCCPADFGACQKRFSDCYYGGSCLGCSPNWCCDSCSIPLNPSPSLTPSPRPSTLPTGATTPTSTPAITVIPTPNPAVCQTSGGVCCQLKKCVNQKFWYGSSYYYTQGGCNPSGIHPFSNLCCNQCQ